MAGVLLRGLFRRLLPVFAGKQPEDPSAQVLRQQTAGLRGLGSNILSYVPLQREDVLDVLFVLWDYETMVLWY